ncbi:MAG: T9SS type A sorting domain-containing protein [Bacteroidales bacterium]|nr:T9SS type A sorting domain-containing protein [Bacteroidales bacterium]MCF8392093.1 T9SS type A sorting domain-containing protein [Bacteroidales bacterium]
MLKLILKKQKRSLFLIIFLLGAIQAQTQSLSVIESAGWLESAFVKWLPDSNAESYNVYFSGEGISNRKIDNQLIRNYGDFYRADVLGLKAGNYTLKVVPVIADVEGAGIVTDALLVEAHDRTGFAFSNGRIPGAYKADGTLKDNAVILYVTQNTKNIDSLIVTGANENPCVGLQMILEGFKKGDDNRPLAVRLVGQITDMDYMDKGDIVIENENNPNGYISFEGVGDDATADGWGIRVKNASNIEIRNIGLMNCNSDEGDDIGLQQDNDYIWVHHCDFFYGDAGSDADQIKGDGALDSKRSGFVTFSYNHFWDTGKSNLLGNGVEDPEYLTYHHNWYDHSDSRHPRVRSHSVHVYNNYLDGIAKYGVGATNASSVFVEANYFRNCKYPILTSMQGSDVFDEGTQTNDYVDMPTFSKEDGGSIKAFNNYMTGQQRFVAYGDAAYPNSTVDFDAYVALTREEIMAGNVVSYQGGNIYNNFDTNATLMYSYVADTPEAAKEKVMKYAGRINGGDFKWTFNNEVDDASYDVIPELKAALAAYETSLVSIQGDTLSGSGGTGGTGGEIEGDLVHNFTLSGKSSSFFNITGNLSDSKGTVNYDTLTLTQCLKIESSTIITFTSAEAATLVLVFNSDFSGAIKINGELHYASAGILSADLPAGDYEITKSETANLYYMSLTFAENTGNRQVGIYDLILYPNPVDDHLFINSPNRIVKLEIYNMNGVLVKSTTDCRAGIDVGELSEGVYLVRLVTDDGYFKRKIIKN